MSEVDAGLYECHGTAAGQEGVVATKVDVVGHAPHSGCLPRDKQSDGPTITGWFSTVMIQSGETARLVCNVEVVQIPRSFSFKTQFQGNEGKKSVIWRDAAGNLVKNEGRYKMYGTDLLISQANWAGVDIGIDTHFLCRI